MPNITDAIKTRRSTRKLKPHPLPTESILEVLEAARWAPSSHNSQPWRFIILTDPEKKRRLAEAMAEAWRLDLKQDGLPQSERSTLTQASAERFAQTPTLVMACLTLEEARQFPDKQRQRAERDLAMQSLGAAIQNLLLAAHVKGLGACWYCAPVFCQNAVRHALKIPAGVEPLALVTLGYPDEAPTPRERKPLRDIAYLNSWAIPLQTT